MVCNCFKPICYENVEEYDPAAVKYFVEKPQYKFYELNTNGVVPQQIVQDYNLQFYNSNNDSYYDAYYNSFIPQSYPFNNQPLISNWKGDILCCTNDILKQQTPINRQNFVNLKCTNNYDCKCTICIYLKNECLRKKKQNCQFPPTIYQSTHGALAGKILSQEITIPTIISKPPECKVCEEILPPCQEYECYNTRCLWCHKIQNNGCCPSDWYWMMR